MSNVSHRRAWGTWPSGPGRPGRSQAANAVEIIGPVDPGQSQRLAAALDGATVGAGRQPPRAGDIVVLARAVTPRRSGGGGEQVPGGRT